MTKIKQLLRERAAWITGVIVLLSFVPVLYCGMFNYASADDFSKSYTVHNVLLDGGTVLDAVWASVLAAASVWQIWEGTWASNFFLAFQPSIWGEHAYAVTVPLCMLYTFAGTGYFLWELLRVRMHLPKKAFWILFWMQAFLFLQFMPYIRGGMFWYTGMAHYVMPMCFTLLMAAWMLKWGRTGCKRYCVYMLLDGIYLGGSHYQHILLVLLVLLTGFFWSVFIDRTNRKRMLFLWLPIAEILAGLYVCIRSPGNLVRGGEGFGVNAQVILEMPLSCMAAAARHGAEYFRQVPLLIPFCVIAFLAGWKYVDTEAFVHLRKIPAVLPFLYLFLLYASVEAPGIYAAGNTAGISGGYFDIVYQCLILSLLVAMLMAGGWLRRKRRVKDHIGKLMTAVVLLLLLLCMKPCIKKSAAYTCYDFARSGRLRDFVIQMEERIELLNDSSLVDIFVPEMNDDQGPFMHLQLSQDSSNYTNEATALYYNKRSVTAVPREEYYRRYAKLQGHEIPEEYRGLYKMD